MAAKQQELCKPHRFTVTNCVFMNAMVKTFYIYTKYIILIKISSKTSYAEINVNCHWLGANVSTLNISIQFCA